MAMESRVPATFDLGTINGARSAAFQPYWSTPPGSPTKLFVQASTTNSIRTDRSPQYGGESATCPHCLAGPGGMSVSTRAISIRLAGRIPTRHFSLRTAGVPAMPVTLPTPRQTNSTTVPADFLGGAQGRLQLSIFALFRRRLGSRYSGFDAAPESSRYVHGKRRPCFQFIMGDHHHGFQPS